MLEAVLRRDGLIVVSALMAVVVLAWAYLLAGAGMSMHEMDGMLMPMRSGPWTGGYALLLLAMWAVMMTAMMLPGSAPMLLLFATIARQRRAKGVTTPATSTFALGYMAVWIAFSLAAVALQFALEHAALLSPMLQTTSITLAGGVMNLAWIGGLALLVLVEKLAP